MKKAILIFFLSVFGIINNSYGQEIVTKNEAIAVKKLVQDTFDEVWSKLDSTQLKKFHTVDFLLLEHGQLWNNDTIANYQTKALKNTPSKRVNSFDFIKLEKYGNSIWVAYHNYATFTKKDGSSSKAQWLESAVAIRTEDGWKLKMLHSTWVPIKPKE